ncbi:unnamed protein product [Prunus armeniaca]|uniref:Uncharacterized protein n=1 Tax=Prunus armeniaca TaxID=36596 RepID=A0A6J5WDT6_PRUAR|nr:unnamed protein product [Prunus armeniaca]
MGMTMSFMELGRGKPSAEMFTFAMGTVVYKQIEKDIRYFEIFHIAIVDIIKTVEIVLQLKMIEVIPDVLFVPSAAVLVLIYASNSILNRDGTTISDVLFVISEMLALIYAKISNMMTYIWIFQHCGNRIKSDPRSNNFFHLGII